MDGITLAKAKTFFARELGDCLNPSELLDTIAVAIEYCLLSGGGKILREWNLLVRDGFCTLPKDLQTPVKYKFSNGQADAFRSAYYSYSSSAFNGCIGFNDFKAAFLPNKTGTQYRIPAGGVRILATTTDDRDVGPEKIMINGTQRGMQISPTHQGFKTSGELLSIYHKEDPNKNYSAYYFNDITSVVKDPTCEYITLSGIDKNGTFYHLSKYHPDEERVEYNEIQFFGAPAGDMTVKVLGRIDPSVVYSRDEDILPLDSLELLKLLAKRAKYDQDGSFDKVQIMEQRIANIINRTVRYQEATLKTLDFSGNSNGYSITNI